jgi:hypothetical protein
MADKILNWAKPADLSVVQPRTIAQRRSASRQFEWLEWVDSVEKLEVQRFGVHMAEKRPHRTAVYGPLLVCQHPFFGGEVRLLTYIRPLTAASI